MVLVGCGRCRNYRVSPDESRPSGAGDLAGGHERPLGEKTAVRTESDRDKCAGWCGRGQERWEAPGAGGATLERPEVQDVRDA